MYENINLVGRHGREGGKGAEAGAGRCQLTWLGDMGEDGRWVMCEYILNSNW